MRGFVETPLEVVDHMVENLFGSRSPGPQDSVLDPGCGTGAFLQGVIRWCRKNRCPLPRLVGVDSDPELVDQVRASFANSRVEIRLRDFLGEPIEPFDFIVGNPPYVPITSLSETEKRHFRCAYETAQGRFDLYLLFFERALKSLKPDGKLVFITPEKYLYVATAAPLRRLLSTFRIDGIELADEQIFGGLVTYPTITSVTNSHSNGVTTIVRRDGAIATAVLDRDGSSWTPRIWGGQLKRSQLVLRDLCSRISCGLATGADSVFVQRTSLISKELLPFAYPTIAGRELTECGVLPQPRYSILVPYSIDGVLMDEDSLNSFGDYLSSAHVRERLMRRTCVKRKPWYAFHETPMLGEILRPKILCKDITQRPGFWIDKQGTLVPRHSVYYIVPSEVSLLEPLCAYLNSEFTASWLQSRCQRAANGFLRLQSNILKTLPVPSSFSLLANRYVKRKPRSRRIYPEMPALFPSRHGR